MAELYRRRVAALEEAINRPDADTEAIEAIRSLAEKIVLQPVDGKLAFDLYGEIGAILKLATSHNGVEVLGPVSEQVMVAGARNSYCSHGLECGFEHEVGHALAEVQDSMQF